MRLLGELVRAMSATVAAFFVALATGLDVAGFRENDLQTLTFIALLIFFVLVGWDKWVSHQRARRRLRFVFDAGAAPFQQATMGTWDSETERDSFGDFVAVQACWRLFRIGVLNESESQTIEDVRLKIHLPTTTFSPTPLQFMHDHALDGHFLTSTSVHPKDRIFGDVVSRIEEGDREIRIHYALHGVPNGVPASQKWNLVIEATGKDTPGISVPVKITVDNDGTLHCEVSLDKQEATR